MPSPTIPPTIRLATPADLPAINDIYNFYVLNSTCTYQEDPEPLPSRQSWFASHSPAHPITVALLENQIVGWGSLSPYHPRSAYRRTVENSLYIHPDFHRRHLGSEILKDLIDRAHALGHHTIIAAIDADQPASLALHQKFGFQKVAHLHQLGFKFHRWLDVIYMQLMLKTP